MGRYVGKGKNRRYQVLKSPKGGGKKRWMFAKMPGRKTKSSKKRARTTRKKSTTRRRTTTVARKKQVRKKNGFTVRILTLLPAGMGAYSTVKDTIDDYRSGGYRAGNRMALMRTTGIDVWGKETGAYIRPLDAHMPIGLAGTYVTKKIVDASGVNKMLGQMHVPVVRF